MAVLFKKLGPENRVDVVYNNEKIVLKVDDKYVGKFDTLKIYNLNKDTGIFELKEFYQILKAVIIMII